MLVRSLLASNPTTPVHVMPMLGLPFGTPFRRAYEYGMEALRAQGVPVEGLRFDPNLVMRGLIMDKELGNLIKVDRFG